MNLFSSVASTFASSLNFRGRSSRLEFGRYIFFYLFATFISIALRIFLGTDSLDQTKSFDSGVAAQDYVYESLRGNPSLTGWFVIETLILTIPMTALMVRRLRDLGHNLFFGFLIIAGCIIPLLNIFFIGYLCIKPGNKDTNRYGAVPEF